MTDLFNTPDRSNKAVLASTADLTTQLAAQRAHDLHRQDRKVLAGTLGKRREWRNLNAGAISLA